MEKYAYIPEEEIDETYCNRTDCTETGCPKHPVNGVYKQSAYPSHMVQKDLAYSEYCKKRGIR